MQATADDLLRDLRRRDLRGYVTNRLHELGPYITKIRKDRLRFLVAALAWNVLISVVPLTIGMIAISNLFLQSKTQQHPIVLHLSRALQGIFTPQYLEYLVNLTVRHAGALAVLGIAAALWAAINVGYAIATSFEALFEVRSRPFLKQTLIDVVMFVVFIVLMLLVVLVTSAHNEVVHLIYLSALPGIFAYLVTTLISLGAAFLLFATIYAVYPNTDVRLRLENVWRGALLAAAIFQLLTFVWPLYAAHADRYGGILVPLLILTGWIFAFATILMIGAEMVAVRALRDAKRRGERIGPPPDGTVPQHQT